MKRFQVVVPPGWTMLDLTIEIDPQIRAFVTRRLSGSAPSRAQALRANLTSSLLDVAKSLADGGAVALTIATKPVDGFTGSPTTVFLPLSVPEGQEPLDVLLAIASTDPTAQAVDVGELVSVRISSTSDATEAVRGSLEQASALTGGRAPEGTDRPTGEHRHVRYLVGDPGDRDRWVDAAFSVTCTSLPGSSELADSAIELFDTTMQSFRWLS